MSANEGDTGRGVSYAILAAILFGSSTPFAKLLLQSLPAVHLAAYLYLGSGLGAAALVPLRRLVAGERFTGPALDRGDILLFAISLLAGGIMAPVALMTGLGTTPASTASLLLNLEAAATAAIATLLFHRRLESKTAGGILILTIAASLLSIRHEGEWTVSAGALLVLVSCVLWGLDNNITGELSLKDPLEIASIKGCVSGSALLVLSVALPASNPPPMMIAAAILLGAISYGISIVLYILAMRALGAVRACSFFSISPFAGAGLSVLLLNEHIDLWFVLALVLMSSGVGILLKQSRDRITGRPA